jgi:hypothetical protein
LPIIQKSNNLLVTTKQIQITNKLIKTEERERLTQLCLRHPDFFVNIISRYYKITKKLLKQYEFEWNWYELSKNQTIDWSIELIEKFTDEWEIWGIKRWDWHELSNNKNLDWNIVFIEKYKDKWSWQQLSKNTELPWNEELIEKYKDKWSWERLHLNPSIFERVIYPHIGNYFIHEFFQRLESQ